MISTRIEEANIASIDKLARSQGISRSDWVRRAILAQLVMDLVEWKKEEQSVPADWEAAMNKGLTEQIEAAPVMPTPEEVMEEISVPREPEPDEPSEPEPEITFEKYVQVYGDGIHHPECIKSIDHEGDCLD